MPKLLVLIDGEDEGIAAVAESIHEGARSVRFAESDLMRLPGNPGPVRIARLRTLDEPDGLLSYDAIVIGARPGGEGGLARMLEGAGRLGMHGKLANKLGSVFPAAAPSAAGADNPLWPLLAPMARYGMILVPPGYAGPDGNPEDLPAAARRLGKRLIDIAAWITHARSHHHH
ncbi:MAG: hypothetical protein H0X64_04405 [Gemmatimonadaceae bacterium]|nr:hypothetical protein [Gemmatimonadaceae bacterium]